LFHCLVGGRKVKKIAEHLTIKDLPKEIRPRERLLAKGAANLALNELVAIIIRTGTSSLTALQVADLLLKSFSNLELLAQAEVAEISGIKGIGQAKAIQIKAALELGSRLLTSKASTKEGITSAEDVFNLLSPTMRYLDKEYFKAIFLNTKNQVLQVKDISIGSLNASLVHPRELFKAAIRVSSAAVILVHNHPSGDPQPSSEDLEITTRLWDAGKILGIKILDHIIIGDNKYVSLKERKIIP